MSSLAVERRLTPDALAEVADLRARGHSWESTARAVGWDVIELRRAVRRAPEFERYYEAARLEVDRESEAEMLLTFRDQLRHPDVDTARKAADAIAKHLAGARRDRTRLEVEQVRADTARAKLEAKKTKAERPAEAPSPTELPPEAVHRPDLESHLARRAANDRAVVWLWGGAHKVGGVAPDAATDTPLALFADNTIPGRKLYWAARFPLPGDPINGPFPAGAQEPVPELGAEHARQLAHSPPDPPEG